MNNSWSRKHEAILQTLYALFLGQLVSFVLAIVGFCYSLNASLGADTPLTLSFFTYFSLTLVYGGILLYRRQKLLVPWYWYVLLGFIDVQGNYLVNKSSQYTSVTSVALLDCFVIAWVMILTWLVLDARYSRWQFLGAAICILGLGLVLLSDAEADGGGDNFLYSKNFSKHTHTRTPCHKPGDDVVQTLFWAIYLSSDEHFSLHLVTPEEFCVKKKDRVEVVAMLVSVCEIAILEKKNLESVTWSTEIILGFAGFAVTSFLFYTLIPLVLKVSGSTMFNLSLLTSDMWAVVMRVFFYHQKVDWLYYASFAIVVIGLVIYSKTEEDPAAPLPALDGGNHTPPYQLLDGESSDSRVEPLVA